jgi:hypothetical protein
MSQEVTGLLFGLIAVLIGVAMLSGWVLINVGTVAVSALAAFGAVLPRLFRALGRC